MSCDRKLWMAIIQVPQHTEMYRVHMILSGGSQSDNICLIQELVLQHSKVMDPPAINFILVASTAMLLLLNVTLHLQFWGFSHLSGQYVQGSCCGVGACHLYVVCRGDWGKFQCIAYKHMAQWMEWMEDMITLG